MSILLNKISLSLCVSALIFATSFLQAAEGPTSEEYGVVLNLSGKQRMLSQKMSKEMMLIALGSNTEANLKNLQKTSELFDKTLKGLKDGDESLKLPKTSVRKIVKQLSKTKKIWIDFHALIKAVLAKKSITKEQVAVLAESNLPLLKNMNKCVKLYEKDAKKAGLKSDPSLAVVINLSGKQRMLTQKMSKEFFLLAYGHNIEDTKLSVIETSTLFERTLKGLLDGDDSLGLPATKDKAIRTQLEVVVGLWEKFKPTITAATKEGSSAVTKEQIKAIESQNIPLLKNMNKAVQMYANSAAK